MEPSTHFLEAQAWFAALGLELPPIPAELPGLISKPYDCCFSTRRLATSAYNFESYLTELAWQDVRDYVVMAHAGHGFNSYALAFYLVREPYAVLLQVPFGGVYMGSEEIEQAKDCFAKAASLIRMLEQKRRSLIGHDRLLVAASLHYDMGAFQPRFRPTREGTSPELSPTMNLQRDPALEQAGVSILFTREQVKAVLDDALAWCAAL